MKVLVNLFALFGAFVGVMWFAGTMGVGDFRLKYGPSNSVVTLSCIEFANADDQSVFNSTGLIRAGAKISNKTERECQGVPLAKQ